MNLGALWPFVTRRRAEEMARTEAWLAAAREREIGRQREKTAREQGFVEGREAMMQWLEKKAGRHLPYFRLEVLETIRRVRG